MSTPIIIGASQYTQSKELPHRLDPLRLMVKVAEMALEDTGSTNVKSLIDAVFMVNINSWSYEDAPKELSEILGINPSLKTYLPDGGNTPQMFVNRAAKAISKGEITAVLIIGAEAEYSALLAKKGKLALNWPDYKEPSYMEGELWDGTTKFENKYKFKYPPYCYALFETAARAANKRTLEDHRKYMGKLFQHYSEVASKNPYAWSKEKFTPDDITISSNHNRYITHPYTKRMCSNMFVDQSAALLMTSEAVAEKLHIEREKWAYIMGGSDMRNIYDVCLRPHLYDSPASKEGSKLALKQAGLTLKDIDAFEIYSCFPSIVEIMTNEIGIPEEDPRVLTLTGGLPFFGGPWSNYSLHGIVSAIDYVRKNPNNNVMVVANGGYNSKQSFGIYGKKPPATSWSVRDDSELQDQIFKARLPDPIEKADGNLTVEAYTITYDRSGNPKEGIIIGMLENGSRTIAFINVESTILKEFEKRELVGQVFYVKYDSKLDRNVAILGN